LEKKIGHGREGNGRGEGSGRSMGNVLVDLPVEIVWGVGEDLP